MSTADSVTAPQDTAPHSPVAERPTPSTPTRRPPPWLLAGVFVVVATAVQLVRQPGVPTWNSLWQEDGSIFLTGALNNPLGSLTSTYNGYLHVVPRLLALVLAQFPLEWVPLLFSGVTALIAALIAVYAYVVGRGIYRTRWAPSALAVLVVALPAAAYEVNADLANLHWYLLFGAFWALLDRPPTRRRAWLAAFVALSAAVSDTLAGLLLPLAIYRVIRGGRRDRAAAAGLVVGLAIQLLFTSSAPKPYTDVEPLQLPATYGLRVVGSLVFGDRYLLRIYGWGGDVLALLLLVAALGVMAVAVRTAISDRARPAGVLAVAASVYSLAYLMIPLLLRGTYLLHGRTLNGARYEVIPVLMLASVVLLVVDRSRVGPRGLGHLTPRLLVGAVGATVVLINLPTHAVRSGGPPWDVELRAAAELCAGGRPVAPSPVRFVPRFPDRVHVPVSPASRTKVPFPASVPCSRLR